MCMCVRILWPAVWRETKPTKNISFFSPPGRLSSLAVIFVVIVAISKPEEGRSRETVTVTAAGSSRSRSSEKLH